MPTFTACTQTEVYHVIETQLKRGDSVSHIANEFLPSQLATFIDDFYSSLNLTLSTERSLSKSLCCFLFELNKAGAAAHYSDIRQIVFDTYEHQVNDYSTLRYFGFIAPSTQGRGYWEITARGISFLHGLIEVPERLTIKQNRVVRSSIETVTIADFPELPHIPYNPVLPSWEGDHSI